MPPIAIELLIIALLILANGFLAMAELAIVSARKARLQQRAEEGDRGAQTVLQLKEQPTPFLSTVQIGITLIGICAGAFAGATIAEELGAKLQSVAPIAPYAEAVSVLLVVVCITYLSLIIGELAPKRLAIDHAEAIACFVARPMLFLSQLGSPLVRLLTASTDCLLQTFGARPSEESPVSEEEIKVLIEEGTKAGVFMPSEEEMLQEVLRLADRKVNEVMTPRKQIVWLDASQSIAEIVQKVVSDLHTNYPVAYGSLDKVVSIVNAKELLIRRLSGQPVELAELVQRHLVVPENQSILAVLETFKQQQKHVALVSDEYGAILGLVTVNDILEAIVGEIPAPGELSDVHATRRDNGSWLLNGMTPVGEFKELFSIKELPGEESGEYHTLGGFVMHQLEHVPSEAESFTFSNLRFEIVDMDRYRVDKVLISAVPPFDKAESKPDATQNGPGKGD